jgi:hypothetical protein
MLGKQFCEKVNEYLTSIGEETSGVGVIQRYGWVVKFCIWLADETNILCSEFEEIGSLDDVQIVLFLQQS